MSKLGRNDLCWCKSGKKYKRCHLSRDRQKKDSPWAAVEANKKEFQKKKCFAQGRGLGNCEGKIVKAHTVSHGPNLSKISVDGKVVQYAASIQDMKKNGGGLLASKIGTRNASVFYGFCAKHDRILFTNIENEDFVGRPDQCLAVAYRTLSRELYGKDASGHIRETLRDADKGTSLANQIAMQEFLELINTGVEAAQKDLKSTHDKLTQSLASGHNDILSSLVIEFDGKLPFMVAGAWSPFTDLFGGKLQSGFTKGLLEQVFLSSFAVEKKSFACISWVDKKGSPGQVIGDQFRALQKHHQANAFLQFAAKHIENLFYSPSWFYALRSDQRKQLDALAASGADALGSSPAAAILLELNFDLPSAARVFLSNSASA